MKMYVADSLVEKLEAEVNRLYMRGHVAAEHHVQEHALRIVYDEPTVDAEPVRHGRWEHTKKHLWHKNKDGEVDMWRLDCGYHNGPSCELCYESFCEHCDPDWAEYECEIGYYVCSACGQPSKTGDLNYCPNCGAKMDGGAEG